MRGLETYPTSPETNESARQIESMVYSEVMPSRKWEERGRWTEGDLAVRRLGIPRPLVKLQAKGWRAFAVLMEHIYDGRYCYSDIKATLNDYSIGDSCFFTIRGYVEFWRECYPLRIPSQPKLRPPPSFLGQVYVRGEMPEWWGLRKSKTLRDLQVESLSKVIAHERTLGFGEPEEEQRVLRPLLEFQRKFQADEAYVAPPSWKQ